MMTTRSATWDARFRLLSRIEGERTAIGDYAGADRALAVRRRAQQAWANEVFRPL